MIGTNWGARNDARARRIAWTGSAVVAFVCGSLGLIVALDPMMWLKLFSRDGEVLRIGASYLRIVGPVYVCFGLGLALFFASQGFGRGFTAMLANAMRLIVGAGAGLAAVYWLALGTTGLFAAIAAGFCVYATLNVLAVLRIASPGPATLAAEASTAR